MRTSNAALSAKEIERALAPALYKANPIFSDVTRYSLDEIRALHLLHEKSPQKQNKRGSGTFYPHVRVVSGCHATPP